LPLSALTLSCWFYRLAPLGLGSVPLFPLRSSLPLAALGCFRLWVTFGFGGSTCSIPVVSTFGSSYGCQTCVLRLAFGFFFLQCPHCHCGGPLVLFLFPSLNSSAVVVKYSMALRLRIGFPLSYSFSTSSGSAGPLLVVIRV
jgi:hypothetical protein